jgi:hypothetical protein
MHTSHLTALSTAVAVMVAAIAVSPTLGYAAAEHSAPRLARSQLKLTVAKGEKALPAQLKASLTCTPTGGSHQQAAAACAAITEVGGDLAALHFENAFCTMQYDPVTVTATGRWEGRAVRYQHTFGNACVLHVETGPVFSL